MAKILQSPAEAPSSPKTTQPCVKLKEFTVRGTGNWNHFYSHKENFYLLENIMCEENVYTVFCKYTKL